mmetsp:Transcript_1240/g.3716  ORF Transcript_1240/g.3716 Transcript_1240/m.3716 type:complete len:200 (+) Transcript_1240:208-807(+)
MGRERRRTPRRPRAGGQTRRLRGGDARGRRGRVRHARAAPGRRQGQRAGGEAPPRSGRRRQRPHRGVQGVAQSAPRGGAPRPLAVLSRAPAARRREVGGESARRPELASFRRRVRIRRNCQGTAPLARGDAPRVAGRRRPLAPALGVRRGLVRRDSRVARRRRRSARARRRRPIAPGRRAHRRCVPQAPEAHRDARLPR